MVSKENEGEEEIWSSWLLSPEILDQSPSRKDGVKEEEEKTYRRRTSIFIEEVASSLKLDWQTQATAQVFFHFFFAHHSFRRHKRFDVAVACIFLSAKVAPLTLSRSLSSLCSHTTFLSPRHPTKIHPRKIHTFSTSK